MAKYGILRNALILLGANNLSGFANEVGIVCKRAMKDSTVFTSPDDWDEVSPANFSGEFNVKGVWDYNVNPDAALWEKHQSDLDSPILISPGEVAAGNRAWFSKIHTVGYGFLGGKNDLAPFAVSAKGNSITVRGIILASQQFTAVGQSTPVEYIALPAGKKLYVSLHCTELDGSDAQFVVQSSDVEAGTYVDRVTLSALSDEGDRWATLDPPLTDTWYRLALSALTGTSATVTVVIGIQ